MYKMQVESKQTAQTADKVLIPSEPRLLLRAQISARALRLQLQYPL